MKPATIYFSDAEHARLVALAGVRHVKLSSLVRSLAMQAVDREVGAAGWNATVVDGQLPGAATQGVRTGGT